MRVIKRSNRSHPRVSLMLADWGVRESFHLLHYLKDQTVPRDSFEVVLVEYYGAVSPAARQFESEIDTWVLLEMPAECYYHKHLMYNAGIVLANGELVMFMDSDAMVRPAFVETILKAFERDRPIVYHMDEFRNVRQDFYPFNYPTFEEVLGDGCVNKSGDKTTGILDGIDPIHSRNSGAAMCARREDLIAIGGADEDLTYLGHICGPYEMSFRLMNSGRRLVWEADEFLYHTWHPGSDGVDNYFGPHDGRNVSAPALQALISGRVRPLIENQAIRGLRTGPPVNGPGPELADLLIDPNYLAAFHRARLTGPVQAVLDRSRCPVFASYRGLDIYRLHGVFYGVAKDSGPPDLSGSKCREDEQVATGCTYEEVREAIDAFELHFIEAAGKCNICAVGKRFVAIPHGLGAIDFQRRSQRKDPRIMWAETIDEARRAAREFTTTGCITSQPPPLDPAPGLAQVWAEVQELQQRLAGVESENEHAANLRLRVDSIESALAQIDRQRITDTEAGRAEAANLGRQIAGMESALAAIGRQRIVDAELAIAQVANLQRQLANVEAGVTAIYQSRIWRALSRVGRLLSPTAAPSREAEELNGMTIRMRDRT